jgi:outer membrane protein assembly factor BamB
MLATCFLAFALAAPPVDSWPQWRGPNRDGVAPAAAWPDTLKDDRFRIVWESPKLGPSYSGPIVSNDTVYTTETLDKNTEVVTAFDRATGKPRWTQRWKGSLTVPFFAASNGSWIRSTPTLDGDSLYVAGIQDRLVCLNAANGDFRWQIDFAAKYDAGNPTFGCVCSPLVDDTAVYMQAGAGFAKVDKKTGGVLWRVLVSKDQMMGSAFSSPVFGTFQGRRCVVVQTRTALVGVNPDDGATLWSREIPSFRGMNILTPVQFGDGVFTSTYGGTTQLFNVDKTSEGLRTADGWSFKYEGNMSTPVVVEGHAYLLGKDQKLNCVDLKTGKRTWSSDKTYGKYWSLVAGGDKILALDQRGTLYLLKANPKEIEILDERKVATDSWAHLAVAGEHVVVRSLDKLAVYRWSVK